MSHRFNQKTVIITGASAGVGAACARDDGFVPACTNWGGRTKRSTATGQNE